MQRSCETGGRPAGPGSLRGLGSPAPGPGAFFFFGKLFLDLTHWPTRQPLTYLMLDASKSIRKLENGTVVVPIIPQMA